MSKIVTYAELKEHNKKESVWLLISGKGALRYLYCARREPELVVQCTM